MKRKNYRNLLNQVPVYEKMPDGWKEIKGAQTAPCGYVWIFNCKSPFGKEYQHALIHQPSHPSKPPTALR